MSPMFYIIHQVLHDKQLLKMSVVMFALSVSQSRTLLQSLNL